MGNLRRQRILGPEKETLADFRVGSLCEVLPLCKTCTHVLLYIHNLLRVNFVNLPHCSMEKGSGDGLPEGSVL